MRQHAWGRQHCESAFLLGLSAATCSNGSFAQLCHPPLMPSCTMGGGGCRHFLVKLTFSPERILVEHSKVC